MICSCLQLESSMLYIWLSHFSRGKIIVIMKMMIVPIKPLRIECISIWQRSPSNARCVGVLEKSNILSIKHVPRYAHAHVYIYIYVYTRKYTYICIHLYINVCVYIYIYIYTYSHICKYVYIYIYVHINVNMYMYISIYVYRLIHIYMYTYTYINTYFSRVVVREHPHSEQV